MTAVEDTAPTETRGPALFSEDAERAVLAGMLLDNDKAAECFRELTPAMFASAVRRTTFEAMQALHEKQITIDPLTLSNELEAHGRLHAAGGKEHIGGLLDEVPTAANIAHHVRIVREFADRRQLRADFLALAKAASDTRIPVKETLDEASQRVLQQLSGVGDTGFIRLKQVMWETMEDIEGRRAGTAAKGLLSGWPELDEKLHGGLEPGTLMVVVGVPSSGKTSFVWNWLCNTALEANVATAMVSAEMKVKMLAESAISSVGAVPRVNLKSGKLDHGDAVKLSTAAASLASAQIFVDDSVMPDIEDVVNRCILLKAQHPNLVAIGVDFIQLLQRRHKDRAELQEATLRHIAYALKGLAMRLGVVVIALAQPNDKQIEDREDKRPQLRDIQGSSGIRQAADVIALMYRPRMYSASSGDELEINLAKNKFGPTARCELVWEGATVHVTSKRRRALEAAHEAAQNRHPELTDNKGQA